MFSVIIPLYNKASYIVKALTSVFDQTYLNYELIIINDGSTDNSLAVVQEAIKDKALPIILLNQTNVGVSKTRNRGVAEAKYEYIVFLDADDWWDPHFLARMAELIADFPEAGVYGSKYFWVKNGNPKASINHESPSFRGYIDYIRAYTFAWWMPLHSISAVIPKKIYNEMNGFNSQLRFGEDFDLWIRIVLRYKVAYLNQPLAYYNQDVQVEHRALGGKRWRQQEHFIFNLDYLAPAEKQNTALKKLLDGLRVRSLLPFYLSGQYHDAVSDLLKKVDFNQQEIYYRRIYSYPLIIVKAYIVFKKLGSMLKQYLLKIGHK